MSCRDSKSENFIQQSKNETKNAQKQNELFEKNRIVLPK